MNVSVYSFLSLSWSSLILHLFLLFFFFLFFPPVVRREWVLWYVSSSCLKVWVVLSFRFPLRAGMDNRRRENSAVHSIHLLTDRSYDILSISQHRFPPFSTCKLYYLRSISSLKEVYTSLSISYTWEYRTVLIST